MGASLTTVDETSLMQSAKTLARRDFDLASILKRYGPPPLWRRKQGFETLIQIILEQQVSLSSAAAMFKRLNESVVPLKPAQVVALGEEHLRSLGITRQKTAYCLHLSQLLLEKKLSLHRLRYLHDDEVKAQLMQVKGVGSWSADVYLLMAMLRPDVWPAGDLALLVAVKRVKNLKHLPNEAQMIRFAERWRPFRSVAARMLWQHYLAEHRNWRAEMRSLK